MGSRAEDAADDDEEGGADHGGLTADEVTDKTDTDLAEHFTNEERVGDLSLDGRGVGSGVQGGLDGSACEMRWNCETPTKMGLNTVDRLFW